MKRSIIQFGIPTVLAFLVVLPACMPTAEDKAEYLEAKLTKSLKGKPAKAVIQNMTPENIRLIRDPSEKIEGFEFDDGEGVYTIQVFLEEPGGSGRDAQTLKERIVKKVNVYPRPKDGSRSSERSTPE